MSLWGNEDQILLNNQVKQYNKEKIIDKNRQRITPQTKYSFVGHRQRFWSQYLLAEQRFIGAVFLMEPVNALTMPLVNLISGALCLRVTLPISFNYSIKEIFHDAMKSNMTILLLIIINRLCFIFIKRDKFYVKVNLLIINQH